jgi:hypothetical protein
VTDAEFEDWHYNVMCQMRRHRFPHRWRPLEAYQLQLDVLRQHNEALLTERDALRMALLGLGGFGELQAIYQDGVAT